MQEIQMKNYYDITRYIKRPFFYLFNIEILFNIFSECTFIVLDKSIFESTGDEIGMFEIPKLLIHLTILH